MVSAMLLTPQRRQPGALERLEAVLQWAVMQTDAAGGVIGVQFLDKIVSWCRVGNIGPSRGVLLDELADQCISRKHTVLGQRLETAQRTPRSSYLRFGARSALIIPLVRHGLVIGVLELLSENPDHFQVLPRGFQRRLENLCDVDKPRHVEADSSRTVPALLTREAHQLRPSETAPCSLTPATSAGAPRMGLPAHLEELRETIDHSSATGTWDDLLTDLAEYLRPDGQGKQVG